MRVVPVVPIVLALAGCGPPPGDEASGSGSSGGAETGAPTTGGVDETSGGSSSGASTAETGSSGESGETGSTSEAGELTTGSEGSDTGMVPPGCEEVKVADPSLEAAIRKALKLPDGPITGRAALELESLYGIADLPPVASFEGLQCFTNLDWLEPGPSVVSDLGPLAELDELGALVLSGSEVSDLSPLSGSSVYVLEVTASPLADLGPVATMPKLHTLRFSQTLVTDLTPLAGHPALLRVTANGTQLGDLSPLATIPELTWLWLVGCGLSEIDGLAGAPGLVELYLDDNLLVELDALAGMAQLVRLEANGNLIADIQGVAMLDQLEVLHLADNVIMSLKPLAGATGLEELVVDGNPLQGLEGIEALPLDGLSAADAGLEVLLPVGPETLFWLNVSGNAIPSLAPLAGHVVLQSVSAEGNAITSLKDIETAWWVEFCTQLRLTDNPLDDETLTTTIPAFCALDMVVSWSGGSCMPDGINCFEN